MLCPYSIIYFDLYSTRNYLTTFAFFRQITRFYGEKPEVAVVDDCPWYRDALNRLGIRRQVVSGGIRNYIERWFETLKEG
jgi:transposase-like protein